KTIQAIRPNKGETWWDACAGSGGKSLMMAAYEPGISLVCTDSRDTILKNLAERFQRTGFKNYSSKMVDLTTGPKFRMDKQLDGIVADVPCTGSGTWSRTPEWLTFFNPKSIEKFQGIQRNIISALVNLLPDNKPLIYITCSVFKEENEDNTAWVTANFPLQLQTQLYIEGSSKGADNMFVARFIRS
ncbi:MAG: RsmB/NOP family class I SAM-dependent RNA methyltransferase, partial [Bacteroidetes bacterium]|nr:RsmB/NOP family class I SAM-dependent RNA methyltransferase [Bacteroidota bacterium]